MDLPLETIIYKNDMNNMNVSIHWVLVHDKMYRKEHFSHNISQSGWFVVNKPIIHH